MMLLVLWVLETFPGALAAWWVSGRDAALLEGLERRLAETRVEGFV